jgi:hypothetical protein
MVRRDYQEPQVSKGNRDLMGVQVNPVLVQPDNRENREIQVYQDWMDYLE